MTTSLLFEQLKNIRKSVNIPLILMGYFNPVLQYGVRDFCEKCSAIGIDGLILPDLPLEEYNKHYRTIFEENNLSNIFLITPQTSNNRIKEIDDSTTSFIYMVSSASTTGTQDGFGENQTNYFERIHKASLKNPQIIGFGISDSKSFNTATTYANGAIIGSAFIKVLKKEGISGISSFIKSIR